MSLHGENIIQKMEENTTNSDPVRSLVDELGSNLARRKHSDIVLNVGSAKRFEIKPSKFVEIKPVEHVRKIAFVDGGSGILDESPSFLVALNRVYYSIFKGKDRIRPRTRNRVQFLSCITSDIQATGGKKKINYKTRLFARDADMQYLPQDADLSSEVERSSVMDGSKLESIGRRFAEWKFALHVVKNELERGDMIVMDGSLQTSLKNEVVYASDLYNTAQQMGVIVCGLSKTSRLITEAGEPLLARVAEIGEEVPFGRWYVKVAEEVSKDDRGFMLAVRLHEKSQFVFRFEIFRGQFNKLDHDELNSIMYSLAANSHDISMLGYPYGAIDADRFAQVRNDEADMYKGYIMSAKLKKPEWRRLQRYNTGLNVHDILNMVTS